MSVTRIEDIQAPGDWVDIRAKVVQLWNSNSESISQAGFLGDETGNIRFVSWKKSQLPLLEKGESYLLKNVVVDEWQNELQLNLNKNTEIERVEKEIEAKGPGLEGTVERIIPESGLILRCPECERVLVEEGVCMVHGEVESQPDLRVKASLRTNDSSQIITLNREITENLLDTTLEEAQEMGSSKMDSLIRKKVVGTRLKVQGAKSGKYFHVNELEPIEA